MVAKDFVVFDGDGPQLGHACYRGIRTYCKYFGMEGRRSESSKLFVMHGRCIGVRYEAAAAAGFVHPGSADGHTFF